MGPLLNLPLTFEQRIAKFSEQVQEETEGEYSVLPMPDGYVQLRYKGTDLLQLKAQGLTYKQLYNLVLTMVKAFIDHQIADIADLEQAV